MKWTNGMLLCAFGVWACSSPSTAPRIHQARGPAADQAPASPYPLSDRFEKLLRGEADDITAIHDGILATQAKDAANGKLLRGTHSKGTCVEGEVEIYDVQRSAPSVASRLKKGIFSVAGTYPVDLRFANAASTVSPDAARDVRAVSMSIHMPPSLSNSQGLMDFAFNNATTFPINDAQVFADIFRLQNGGAKSAKELGFWRDHGVGGALIKGKIIQEQPAKTAYQRMRYWSTVPFALGPDEAVKYSLKPCASNSAQPLDKTNTENELKSELVRHVNNDEKMSCFEFEVQLLDADRMTHGLKMQKESESWWVENASVEWHESEAPFYPVGMLTLVSKSVVEDPICEKRWINVLVNNNLTHHGLGSINRARTAAESASADKRLSQ